MNRIFVVGALVIVVAMGAFFFFRGRPTQVPTAPPAPSNTPADTTSPGGDQRDTPPAQNQPPAQPTVQEVTITAKQWEFQPPTITVKKGQLVRLHIKSIDVTHGFSLSDFGVNVTLTSNQTQTVEFTPNTVGTFSFFCSVFCGSGHSGMRGTLRVTE